MKIIWRPWMKWIDEMTGNLKPGAPPSAVRKYNAYQEARRRYKAGEYPPRGEPVDPPDDAKQD